MAYSISKMQGGNGYFGTWKIVGPDGEDCGEYAFNNKPCPFCQKDHRWWFHIGKFGDQYEQYGFDKVDLPTRIIVTDFDKYDGSIKVDQWRYTKDKVMAADAPNGLIVLHRHFLTMSDATRESILMYPTLLTADAETETEDTRRMTHDTHT